MTGKAVHVLIVDDHAVVREGYRTLIEKHAGLRVVGEAADAASAYQVYKDTRPDVVIMDISMPGRGGIDAIEHIRRFDAQARILVFTMHSGAPYALQAFRAGAKGYVTKSSPPEFLVSAVRAVSEGRIAICPEISETLALDQVLAGRESLANLSPREFEILRMILDARSTDQIASALNISRKTAANYHYSIKSKLGVTSDIELLYLGMRHGLVTTGCAEIRSCQLIRRPGNLPRLLRATTRFATSVNRAVSEPDGREIREEKIMTFKFDQSGIRWNTLEGIDDVWYHILEIDEKNRIVDILFKFSANAKVVLHRHHSDYRTFTIQGELRLYNSRNELTEVRGPGAYVAKAAGGAPHREGGGDQDVIALFSNRNVAGPIYEILDDQLQTLAMLDFDGFKELLKNQTSEPAPMQKSASR